ncbi:monooxygenase 2-like isoform X1 [Malania oleifera]|uniref:monooxygenase 2-like isoform X1 n=1 Tax=Malania oleifera TaxID=397392 RepID=UPI0025ADCD7D|nr:monooxygenase 2-like isoform X1 [Malania oleifera]
MPCNEKTMYWFFTFTSLDQKPLIAETEDDMEDNPAKMKQFVLSKLGKLSQQVQSVVERTELVNISCASLKLRWPWDLLRGEICRGNVCVAGDALHPMTPDIGQGGCSALEDGVVLARCLGDAFLAKTQNGDEWGRIEKAVEKYGKERRWRSIGLIATAYTVGMVQQSDGKVMSFLRDNLLPGILAGSLLKMADFDCGKLN